MLRGETVGVVKRTPAGQNPFGAPVLSEEVVAVSNVLVAPGAATDVIDSNRPAGAKVAFTCYFPKTFTDDLRGCAVRVRGQQLEVIGDPQPYPDVLTPGAWNRVVEVGRVDG